MEGVSPMRRLDSQCNSAMATGLGDHPDRDLHPRSWDQSLLDGDLHPQVGATSISDGRDSDLQRLAEVVHGFVETKREGGLQVLPEIDVAEHDVGVAVEEPRDRCLPDT